MYLYLKRIIDILLSLVGIAFLSPFMIVTALLIKATSRGPVIYKGLRTGIFDSRFYIYKFRSMYVGSDTGSGTTSKNDLRVTPFGKVMRRHKIDEIPQLFNILKGEMSLIGPRPELPFYTDQYSLKEKNILSVYPGITDLSSIKFSSMTYSIPDDNPDNFFEANILREKNKMRLKYVENISFKMDLKIFLQTVETLLRRK
jgi:lipopolysaccharide/colanic/teichoic acid biosynthesis glycosyltransferase